MFILEFLRFFKWFIIDYQLQNSSIFLRALFFMLNINTVELYQSVNITCYIAFTGKLRIQRERSFLFFHLFYSRCLLPAVGNRQLFRYFFVYRRVARILQEHLQNPSISHCSVSFLFISNSPC